MVPYHNRTHPPGLCQQVMVVGAIVMVVGAIASLSSSAVATNPKRQGMSMVAIDSTDEQTFHKAMKSKPSSSLADYPEVPGWFWDDDWVSLQQRFAPILLAEPTQSTTDSLPFYTRATTSLPYPRTPVLPYSCTPVLPYSRTPVLPYSRTPW